MNNLSFLLEANPLGALGFPFIMIIAMVAMLWFSSRSQKKRDQEAQDMRDSLQVGDEITTIGGVIGKVVSIKGETFVLETTKEKTHMRFLKASIRSIDVKVAEITAAESDKDQTENEQPKTMAQKFAALSTPKKILASVAIVAIVVGAGFGFTLLGGNNNTDGTAQGDYSEGLKFDSLGNGTCSVIGMGTCEDTVIKIPATSPAGDSVVYISAEAFKDNTTITGVVIPDSVTDISDGAFSGCTALASVTFGKNVKAINDEAFRGCTALTEITIPTTVTSISNKVFYGCTGLKTITIHAAVTEIGFGAFADCDALTSVVIPTGVTSIGNSAFYGCDLLATVEIQGKVEIIDALTFAECSSLTKVILDDSVAKIDATAFSGCTLSEICYTGTEEEWKLISGTKDAFGEIDPEYNYNPKATETEEE